MSSRLNRRSGGETIPGGAKNGLQEFSFQKLDTGVAVVKLGEQDIRIALTGIIGRCEGSGVQEWSGPPPLGGGSDAPGNNGLAAIWGESGVPGVMCFMDPIASVRCGVLY
jgi:hypothetical protein